MLTGNVLGNTKPGVLDIHLDEDFTVLVVEFLVGVDTAVHLGRFLDLMLGVKLEARVDTADVLTADECDAGDGGADCEVFPVCPCNFRRAERPGKDREAHLYFLVPAVLGLGIHG